GPPGRGSHERRSKMMHRLSALAVLALLACGPAREPSAGAPPAVQGEFRDTHHAVVRGSVVDGRGRLLEAIEVAAVRLADPSVASLAYASVRTDGAGSFTLPVGVIVHDRTDTATLRLVVRAAAFPPRYPRPSPDAYHTAETTVAVRVVRAGRPAETFPVRLVLPIP
ncbi:MAG TPA: hypothetical protein VF263_23645, partial [Longimicrobiaceae bacterium]